jgi:hypothetical protein
MCEPTVMTNRKVRSSPLYAPAQENFQTPVIKASSTRTAGIFAADKVGDSTGNGTRITRTMLKHKGTIRRGRCQCLAGAGAAAETGRARVGDCWEAGAGAGFKTKSAIML